MHIQVSKGKKKFVLTKTEIIRRPIDFSLIFKTGQFLRGRYFNIVYVRANYRQVAFAASKRVRTTVERNHIKRMLREAYRLEKDKIHEHVQLILVGKENILCAHLNDLRAEMRKMATRIIGD
ncbi:MAG: ribonuclease P protein component [candidate division KSB1 bacterium]|nr:ribonuclease P protein component [candidate division KSB1 bacterium]MDZ7301958.1 ribonuclease P protein component [candidate division KSB1 bacterium]MDZ7312363.1 ribonuclease P protein component [candidate division KSB1 bacterium]